MSRTGIHSIVLFSIGMCDAWLSASGENRGVRVEDVLGQDADVPRYHALVIGIDEYDHWQDLRHAQRDAQEVANLLGTNFGFEEVSLLPTRGERRVTREVVLGELSRLTKGAGGSDALLIYFAGHGHYDKESDMGYWITSEARETVSGSSAENGWILGSQLMPYIRATKARHVLVVSDARFSGSLFRSGNTDLSAKENTWYQRAISNPSRWGMSSGDLETVPNESVFATKFLQILRDPPQPVFSASDLASRLKLEAAEHTDRQPLCGPLKDPKDMRDGEFVFVARGHQPGGSTPLTPPQEASPLTPGGNAPTVPRAGVMRISADVWVESEPQGAEIYVDGEGESRGKTPAKVTIDLAEVKTKDVRISLRLDDYATKNLVVTVERGQEVRREPLRLEKRTEAMVYTTWPFNETEAKRRQKETAEALGVPVEYDENLDDGVKMQMVLIPAGEFMMGSPDGESGRSDGEGPVHRVHLTKPFYIGKYEVTQAQWRAVTGSNPSHFKGEQNPVEKVSWNACQHFVKELNSKLSKEKGMPAAAAQAGRPAGSQGKEFSLPTEAQWEYACRGGADRRFCFGDGDSSLSEYAWFESNSGGKTHPAGQKKPNALGLYDMHGNVWEWCQDWDGSYSSGEQRDPIGPNSGSSRGFRGGSWRYGPGFCRCAFRNWGVPDVTYNLLGFRVARSCP